MRKKRQLPTTEENVQLASELRLKLARIGIDLAKHPALDSLPVDLADIYEVCASYQYLIDSFLAMPSHPSSKEVMNLFADVYNHLYIHLPYHHKRLPKGLEKLEVELEPDESKREAYAEERFQHIMRKTRTMIASKRKNTRKVKPN